MFIHSLVEAHFLKPLSIGEKTSKKTTKITNNTREREREREREDSSSSLTPLLTTLIFMQTFRVAFSKDEFEFIIQVSVLFYRFCMIILCKNEIYIRGEIILLFYFVSSLNTFFVINNSRNRPSDTK